MMKGSAAIPSWFRCAIELQQKAADLAEGDSKKTGCQARPNLNALKQVAISSEFLQNAFPHWPVHFYDES